MSVKIDFSFDSTDEDAIAAAEELAATMITDITDETEASIRNLIADAIREGIPPYDAARLIHDTIGLTSAQGQAAMKYRTQLIDNGLAIDKVDEKFAEYADGLLETRAEMIARTEIMGALNAGQDRAWQQAQDEGLLSAGAEKEWILSEDACDDCQDSADSGPVPIGEEFDDGDPPLHPNCRCTIGISTP